jgi:hypothetical protein
MPVTMFLRTHEAFVVGIFMGSIELLVEPLMLCVVHAMTELRAVIIVIVRVGSHWSGKEQCASDE